MKKICVVLATLASLTTAANAVAVVPDGIYAQWMKDGKCVAFTIKEGKPVKFVIAPNCDDAITAKNAELVLEGKQLKAKGAKYTFGAATYTVKEHDRGLLDGTWSYKGSKDTVKFLVRKPPTQ